MKKLLWMLLGVVLGAVAAHSYSKTDSGKNFFSEVDRRAKEIGDAVYEGYKERESELKSAVQNLENAVKDLRK